MSYHSTIGATAQFYWTLNDNAANFTVSAAVGGVAGTSNNNTNTYSSATTAAGVADRSLDFNGSTDYITFGDNNEFSPIFDSAMSWSMWVYPEANSVGFMAGKNNEWFIGYGEGGSVNKFFCMIRGTAGEYLKYTVETGTSALNAWYHIGVSWDGTTLHLYKNGSNVSSYDINGATTAMGNTSSSMEVGRNVSTQYFNGKIQAFGIWDSVLTGTDFTNHYNAGANASTPVTVNATVTNISVGGNTITGRPNVVLPPVSNIAVTAPAASVSAGGSTTINADTALMSIAGQPATVTITANRTIDADVAFIAVDAKDATFSIVTESWDLLIAADNPTHWWKFNSDLTDSGLGTEPFTGSASYGTTNPITGSEVDIYLDSGTLHADGVDSNEIAHTNAHGSTLEFFVRTSEVGSTVTILTYKQQTSLGSYSYVQGSRSQRVTYVGMTPTRYMDTQWTINFSAPYGECWGIVNGYLAKGVFATGWSQQLTTTVVVTGPIGDPLPASTPPTAAQVATLNTTPYQISWTISDAYVTNGQWNHIVVSTEKVGATYTYNMYLNGAATSVALPYSSLYFSSSKYYGLYIGTETRTFLRNGGSGGDVVKTIVHGATVDLDELVTYNYGLTAAEALQHSDARNGSSVLDPSPTIEADAANITVSGIAATPGSGSTIPTTVASITVSGRSANVSGLGSRNVGSDVSLLTVTGHDVSVTTTKSVNMIMEDNPGGIAVSGPVTNVLGTTNDLTFSFVAPDTIALSSYDAPALTQINMGAFLFAQSKDRGFKIANKSLFYVSYVVKAESTNVGVSSAVGFSLDNDHFFSSIEVPAVGPNQITPTIYMKMYISSSLQTGDGNFLINVEPTNVGS